jgi:hypothetical protein
LSSKSPLSSKPHAMSLSNADMSSSSLDSSTGSAPSLLLVSTKEELASPYKFQAVYPCRIPLHIKCSRISLQSLQNELTHFLQRHSILFPTAEFLNAKVRKLLTPCEYSLVCLESLLIHDLSMILCGEWLSDYTCSNYKIS